MSNNKKVSKLLSLVLRHKPEHIGIELDTNGWADIAGLICACRQNGIEIDRELIEEVVKTNDKKRFSISGDGQRIRANQGHSIQVDLALKPVVPPGTLLHGTCTRFLENILSQGLLKMDRHHVHLTESPEIARQVGSRYGKIVLLEIDSYAMHDNGAEFYISENNVWLVDHVPAKYIKVI